VIDEQNINLMSYQLPGRTARALPVAAINFAPSHPVAQQGPAQ
jgi:hypothetical protein